MKKLVVFFLSFFIIIGVLFLTIKLINENKVCFTKSETAYINYIYDDKNIHSKLTKSETKEILEIVNEHHEYFYDYGNDFTDNISIVFENTFFDDTVYVSCDGSDIIKLEDKCIHISSEQRKRINEIFEKYGGCFPAV